MSIPTKVQNKMVVQMGPDNNCLNITFNRTLRIPDDNKTYPLPPSLGLFPVCKVDDYKKTVPKSWLKHGGVFIPMFQREAMWLQFNTSTKDEKRPKALKVAVGKVNAISGKTWKNNLDKSTNDYVVVPDQPWLDGINAGNGFIKQFVAMPLGQGYTVEAQVTGKEEFGGIQLLMYDSKQAQRKPKPVPKPKPFPTNPPVFQPFPTDPPPYQPFPTNPHFPSYQPYAGVPQMQMMDGGPVNMMGQGAPFSSMSHPMPMAKSASVNSTESFSYSNSRSFSNDRSKVSKRKKRSSRQSEATEMGISAGGKMKQKIYKDPYGFKSWDTSKCARIYVHIVNSAMYKKITGEEPPETPISAKTYTNYGYPWYDVYDEHKSDIKKSNILSNVKSISQLDKEKYGKDQQDNSTVPISNVQELNIDSDVVRDGEW